MFCSLVTKPSMTTVSSQAESLCPKSLGLNPSCPPGPLVPSTGHPFLQLCPKKKSLESSDMPLETKTKHSFPNLHAETIFNKVKNNFLENNKYSTTLLSIVSRLQTTGTQGLLNNSGLNFCALETSDRGNCSPPASR